MAPRRGDRPRRHSLAALGDPLRGGAPDFRERRSSRPVRLQQPRPRRDRHASGRTRLRRSSTTRRESPSSIACSSSLASRSARSERRLTRSSRCKSSSSIRRTAPRSPGTRSAPPLRACTRPERWIVVVPVGTHHVEAGVGRRHRHVRDRAARVARADRLRDRHGAARVVNLGQEERVAVRVRDGDGDAARGAGETVAGGVRVPGFASVGAWTVLMPPNPDGPVDVMSHAAIPAAATTSARTTPPATSVRRLRRRMKLNIGCLPLTPAARGWRPARTLPPPAQDAQAASVILGK